MSAPIPWNELFDAATKVREAAHAPYSDFRVGACLLTDDGDKLAGCNVENASFGLCLCAERSAVAQMVARRAGKPRAIAIVTAATTPTPPCGMCRQVLAEFGTPSMEVRTRTLAGVEKVWTLGALLPDAFTGDLMD